MSDAGWFYFGCGREAGHDIHDHTGQRFYSRPPLKWEHFDGVLPPQPETAERYLASFSRLGAWGKSALSWWDGSVDKRPGSNSTVFAPSLTISPADMYSEAQRIFPWVFSRLPQPLKLQLNAERVFGPLAHYPPQIAPEGDGKS